MVEAELNEDTRTTRIILRPNQSWSWRANLYLLGTLVVISFSIGFAFLLAGAWVILPFSILEMFAVTVCLYYCVRQCHRQEVITITEHALRVERGGKRPVETWDYHRIWAKFMVRPARHPWDPAVVSIRCRGQDLEIGQFLSRRDKSDLVAQLRKVVARMQPLPGG